ncbi:MAG: glycerate kinase family protein [Acidimicrobiales bacterium]
MTSPAGTVVLAFDKFRGTATSIELADAGARAASRVGWTAAVTPLADGGEGSLDAVGGANKVTEVTGPLGHPVEAGWRLDGKVAYVEMAAASGLLLAGGPEHNDPMAAETVGTGELIAAAIKLGARKVVVFLGGSATTDGGWGAVRAMPPAARLKEIELVIATDVRTAFCDAAAVFGPQKGARPSQVAMLERRLQRLVQVYQDTYGVDVSETPGAGAAGGLAGGLMALGGRIESGFDVIAEQVGLDERLQGADVVVTGEGFLDAESFNGKVVGGVAAWAAEQAVPVLAIVGDRDVEVDAPEGMEVVTLSERFGLDRAMAEPVALTEQVIAEHLERLGSAPPQP